jgi:uncharacterized repeat protein (TIGR01451 family)
MRLIMSTGTPCPRPRIRLAALAGAAAVALGGSLAAAPPASAVAQDADAPTVGIVMAHGEAAQGEPGEVIAYAVVLTNDADADASGYQVATAFPDGIVNVVWTCTAEGDGSACGDPSGTGDLAETVDVGAAGGSVVYTLFATVDPAFTGVSLTASATLTPSADGGCEPCLAGTTVGEVPRVVLFKDYAPRNPDPAPGEDVTFTVTLTNDTAADATGYVIEGLLPPEIINQTWTCTPTGAASNCGVDTGIGYLADTADVAAGGSVVYVLSGTVNPEMTGEFVEVVTLVPGPGQACTPVETTSSTELGDVVTFPYGFGDPLVAESMVCRVNNVLLPPSPEQPPGGNGGDWPDQEWLPDTGSRVVAYLVGGGAAVAVGAVLLLWSRGLPVRRRRLQP